MIGEPRTAFSAGRFDSIVHNNKDNFDVDVLHFDLLENRRKKNYEYGEVKNLRFNIRLLFRHQWCI